MKPAPIPNVTLILTMAALGCAATHGQVNLFSDHFDAGTSAGQWNVFSQAGDYTADFAFDYSTRGIPPAPNSAGSTIGLKLTVNNNDLIAARDAVSVYPIGLNLSGKRTLKFDMWINYNGGPGGGSGSTEFATFGLLHSGTQVCNPDNPSSDGFWFAVTGEGGASEDYRAYRNSSLLNSSASAYSGGSLNHTASYYQNLFKTPPFETSGAPGKQWIRVQISVADGVVQWRLNDRLVALRYDTSRTAGNLMLGYMDTFTSIANPAADNFVIFDNVRVEGPDCDSNGIVDEIDLGHAGRDCNQNGRLDACETESHLKKDGDFDQDGDLDTVDRIAFMNHVAGPGKTPITCTGPLLAAFDLETDSDLDLRDLVVFQRTQMPGPFNPRSTAAWTGSQVMAQIATLTLNQREARILSEIQNGNVPGFIRDMVAANVIATVNGSLVEATYLVTPDYLCIGRDDDYVRIPMTPATAQAIADTTGCVLPTRKMVNDIYSQASIKLAPQPISPATVDITLVTTFLRHLELVESQRGTQPLGPLIGGIKKDVVITPRLVSHPNKVAIYGWHQLNGQPIQPLYLGHVDWYVDYSHGIRLVLDRMLIDGVENTVSSVLAHPQRHVLLSDEGPINTPRY